MNEGRLFTQNALEISRENPLERLHGGKDFCKFCGAEGLPSEAWKHEPSCPWVKAVLVVERLQLEYPKTFYVEGFGEVGAANLESFAPNPGFRDFQELLINETTEGKFMNTTSDKKPERITRIK